MWGEWNRRGAATPESEMARRRVEFYLDKHPGSPPNTKSGIIPQNPTEAKFLRHGMIENRGPLRN